MPRPPRSDPQPPEDRPAHPDAPEPAPGRSAAGVPSLAGMGIAGITRRRVAWVGLAALAAWIVVGFAGQAAEASRASARVAEEEARNAAVAAETAALRDERDLVTQEPWVLQEARAYQLGSRHERPFALAPGAPALPDDAPGSPARRLGVVEPSSSPLEGWLDILFGPQR